MAGKGVGGVGVPEAAGFVPAGVSARTIGSVFGLGGRVGEEVHYTIVW